MEVVSEMDRRKDFETVLYAVGTRNRASQHGMSMFAANSGLGFKSAPTAVQNRIEGIDSFLEKECIVLE